MERRLFIRMDLVMQLNALEIYMCIEKLSIYTIICYHKQVDFRLSAYKQPLLPAEIGGGVQAGDQWILFTFLQD